MHRSFLNSVALATLLGFGAFATDADSIEGSGISVTTDDRILVELKPEDSTPASLFDLNGRTLKFMPDGSDGYSREVTDLEWEEEIGQAFGHGTLIPLEQFTFDFAGSNWDAFYLDRYGSVTFGGRSEFGYRGEMTMREVARTLGAVPRISPLYKPSLFQAWTAQQGSAHVSRRSDRVVVTWVSTEPSHHVHGTPPDTPSRIQLALHADGRIVFSYMDVLFGDGVVGLFSGQTPTKDNIIASFDEGADDQLPGFLDVLNVAIYSTNSGDAIVEFTTRGPVLSPSEGDAYEYRLYFDTDKPYWDPSMPHAPYSDADFTWYLGINADGWWSSGNLFETGTGNRIAYVLDLSGNGEVSGSIIVDAIHWKNDTFFMHDLSNPVEIKIPYQAIDLSEPETLFSQHHREIFHYPGVPNLTDISCRIINSLGDIFDALVFHNEFRIDASDSATPWWGFGERPKGIGRWGLGPVPCGSGRLKGHWALPVWMKSWVVFDERLGDDMGFDEGSYHFAHELGHTWSVYISYDKDGTKVPLYGDICGCHWRMDLAQPLAFHWRNEVEASLMGGANWIEQSNGTFMRSGQWRGISWLDLYVMGLADASEVPDMMILRNLQTLPGQDPRWGLHTAEKEIVTIEQIIAAEGPRVPSQIHAQKTLNVGFVYLLEPGKTPSPDLFSLHARYRERAMQYWSHVTGGRSQITTSVGRESPR